jgi:flagellar biosynthesis protein
MSDTPPKDINLAVALEYERGTRDAPRVVAKGRGEIAKKIVEIAAESGVHIDANGPLAEALAGVNLDEPIPIELYEAVAEIIGFVLRASQQKRWKP